MPRRAEDITDSRTTTGQPTAGGLEDLQSIKQLPRGLGNRLMSEGTKIIADEYEGAELETIFTKGKGRGYLVVRDEDLGLFDALCTGLQAAAGAGFFLIDSHLPPAAIGSITAIIITAFKVLRRLVQKGAVVDPSQIQVILALKKQGAMSVQELVKWLNKTDNKRWTAHRVNALLKTLECVRLVDGTIVTLAGKTSDGRWGLRGI